MNLTAAEIENVVRRVLSRLTEAAAPEVVAIRERVVTTATLQKLAPGTSAIEFGSRAIVTPAAIDWMKEKKIAWNRRAKVAGSNPQGGNGQTVGSTSADLTSPVRTTGIVIGGSATWFEQLKRQVCPKQANVQAVSMDDASALREAQNLLRSGFDASMLIVRSPHATCWQAARDERLRPAVVSDWNQLVDVLKEVPANLLILGEKEWTFHSAANAVRHWYRTRSLMEGK